MPEGDTVWLAAQRLRDALGGRALTSSDFRVPALATLDLAGVGSWTSFRVASTCCSDLTTAGRCTRTSGWTAPGTCTAPERHGRSGARDPRRPAHPGVDGRGVPAAGGRAARDSRRPTVVGHLGPDLLGPDWDEDEAVRRLAASAATEIGVALLDQRKIAGIGLVYQSETLFLCGVNPFTPVSGVSDLRAVVRTAHRLLTRNAPRPSQSTTGDERRPHYVYGRARRACYRCGATVRTAEQGEPPRTRDAYWCPTCQPKG